MISFLPWMYQNYVVFIWILLKIVAVTKYYIDYRVTFSYLSFLLDPKSYLTLTQLI